MIYSSANTPKMSREELDEYLSKYFAVGGAISRPAGSVRTQSKPKFTTMNRAQREAKGIVIETLPPQTIVRTSK